MGEPREQVDQVGQFEQPVDVARHAPGWREVLIVAAIVVGAVFAIQVLTSLLPKSMQEVVFHTPLTILVLIVGTLGLLLRIARRRSS